jgi:hypothetical protein
MTTCTEFAEFLLDDETELGWASREARDAHAHVCEDCNKLLEGHRAFLEYRVAVSNGAPRERDAPWVLESVLRVVDEEIARRDEASRERVVARRKKRRRVLALASTGALALAGTLAARPELVAVTGELADVPRRRPRDAVMGPPRLPADAGLVAPVQSPSGTRPKK